MAITRDSIQDVWGARTLNSGEWAPRVDECTLEEPDNWVQSACVLCSNGCALDIGVKNGRIVGVRGREADRVNRGRLGPKGLHGWEANHSSDRLTVPLVRSNGRMVETTWEEAIDLLVSRSKEIKEKYTAGAIGIYNSGQLFLEEYYTLAVIAKAGLGTPHTDGNTRLCTATASTALMETFGSDGQPCSYADLDITDAIFHFGHNIAATQTVLWSRVLDRLVSPNPPKLIVVDPRRTATAREANIHLAPKAGTNLALLNGLLNLLIKAGHVDNNFINSHTIGFDQLEQTVSGWTVEKVEHVTGVPANKLEAAADVLGTTPTLVSSLLQGVYQSMQATASACQINNLHLIRGMIGRPGCGILQMNGQPTSQNTRECGANGEMPGFRNWANPEHMAELARIWNVDASTIPHGKPPTHAMEIFRHAEDGTIRMLWIICTNPAVSMPDLGRVRRILEKEGLFVVVQDSFLTETAQLADLVLPAAMWGEKTGTFTNTDRTVHISYKAIEPPGAARSDFEIFLNYAKRMDFRDKDGQPLIKWTDPESAFEAWKVCSKGRPCDYTGITYARLTGGSGIQWPCNDMHPNGTERLYTDLVFPTDPAYCEEYGHDIATGASLTPEQYKAMQPNGKAFLKAAEYVPPIEQPDEEYPFWFSTGRLVYHFHTRTKTGRARALNQAAPEPFVQLAPEDAARYGISEGDTVQVESRRGRVAAPARIGDIEVGHVFMPFHYGKWDDPEREGAANELTMPAWDPVSKQPYLKFAAVRIGKG